MLPATNLALLPVSPCRKWFCLSGDRSNTCLMASNCATLSHPAQRSARASGKSGSKASHAKAGNWTTSSFATIASTQTPMDSRGKARSILPLASPGLHIVASETDHWVENLTGLGGCGAHLALTVVSGHAQQGHPLLAVLQVAEPAQRGGLPWQSARRLACSQAARPRRIRHRSDGESQLQQAPDRELQASREPRAALLSRP